MNKQEIYDKVCAHLAAQKTRSMRDDTCAYRGEKGTACAVGCLIPDAMYRPDMDTDLDGSAGLDVESLFGRFTDVSMHIGSENLPLLQSLQMAHDFKRSPESMRVRLREAALVYDIAPGAEQAITEWS